MSEWDWTRVVIDHVHLRVRDVEASVAFYKAALVVTDGEPITSDPVHISP